MFLWHTSLFYYVLCLVLIDAQLNNEENCECVPYYLCNNGTINNNGENIIDVRMGSSDCDFLDTCCGKADVIKQPSNKDLLRPKKSGCGYRNLNGIDFQITGGINEAQFGEFPWMVAILGKNVKGDEFKYKCGGSLIHPQVVLTAAHCVINDRIFRVRAGEWDTKTTREQLQFEERVVKHGIIHRHFSKTKLHNDIALLILKSPFNISSYINVVCLPDQQYVDLSSECFVTGWGKNKFESDGEYSNILKKIQLPFVEHQKCQNAFRNTRLGKYFKLHASFVCAGGEEGKDACSGDGGGPLVCPIKGQENKYQEVGIVSWGIDCGVKGVPGAYVNVAYHRKWIDQQMQEKNFSITYDFNDY